MSVFLDCVDGDVVQGLLNEMFRISSPPSPDPPSQIHSMAVPTQGVELHHPETIKIAGDKRIIASKNTMVR